MVKCSCKDRQIFVRKLSHFLKILLMNAHNFSVKHINLQLAQTPVFDERYYQYTQSVYIVKDADMFLRAYSYYRPSIVLKTRAQDMSWNMDVMPCLMVEISHWTETAHYI